MLHLLPRRSVTLAIALLSLVPAVPLAAFGAASEAAPKAAPDAAPGATRLSLETIMGDPDWIGNAPEKPYWADDGRAVYYQQKRAGSELRDLYRLPVPPLAGTAQLVADAQRGAADAEEGQLSRDRKWRVYIHEGNVFVRNRTTGAVRQITRTPEAKSEARFMAGDQGILFRVKDNYFTYDLRSGLFAQAADLRLAKDPAEEDAADFLRRENLHLFTTLREDRDHKKEARERAEAEQRADATRPSLPWYLGDKVKIDHVVLSPNGDWMLVATQPKEAKPPKPAVMPRWVTESGYVDPKDERPFVGTEDGSGDKLILLDLRHHQRHDLDLGALPGIKEDPLKAMREAAAARAKAQAAASADKTADKPAEKADGKAPNKPEDKPEDKTDKLKSPDVRPVDVLGIQWSDDGRRVAVELVAVDHKDRWIATVDLEGGRLVPRHRETDKAWINWNRNAFGWLADNETLYFESEESGWNHLYTLDTRTAGEAHPRQLTHGKYEINAPEPSFDGRTLYYTANDPQPGQYDVWRVDVASGRSEQLTHLGGLTDFKLSPDERQLLLIHSSVARHDDLYLQANRPGAAAHPLTDTVSAAFKAVAWTMPEIVPVPSQHGAGPIYSRLYLPAAGTPSPIATGATTGTGAAGRPAVVFVHGAGYLQDAHAGWSYYFHEFMFHSFLTQHGYVVLDMDYRASQGYGRDWRTAIYRQMGHPELEDLEDGVDWLVRQHGVDRARVGVYGGSYGGFMTLMAMFRRPNLFAAGAALRPVTDWSDYNDGYTGAILNTPEIDPEAYDASSPIEYADGLARPLLICHGMVDDNVLFQDSVRLVQRLIELKKENFELAPFPVEAHGFKRPDSWLNEYRRIYKLMSSTLQ